MAMMTEKAQVVSMSIRMRRVLAAVKRMPTADRFRLLVKAGLMTQAEAEEAVIRQIPRPANTVRHKSKARRKAAAKKAKRPRWS
jgi:hypothetical protein